MASQRASHVLVRILEASEAELRNAQSERSSSGHSQSLHRASAGSAEEVDEGSISLYFAREDSFEIVYLLERTRSMSPAPPDDRESALRDGSEAARSDRAPSPFEPLNLAAVGGQFSHVRGDERSFGARGHGHYPLHLISSTPNVVRQKREDLAPCSRKLWQSWPSMAASITSSQSVS